MNSIGLDESENLIANRKYVNIWKYCGVNKDKTRISINAECIIHDNAGSFTANYISVEQYTDRLYLNKIVTDYGTSYNLSLKTYHRLKGRKTKFDIPSIYDWKVSVLESVYLELLAEDIFKVEQPF
ncbi:hypothetical protein GHT89_16510 [Acinetobacter baumannii]|uniref:hypothetical protein n=1 Tax=Acinetobacter baumannii TaxID=470 RepID=UPI00387DD18D